MYKLLNIFRILGYGITENKTNYKSTLHPKITQRELCISSKVDRTNEKVLIINYNLVKKVVLELQQIVPRPRLMFLCLTCTQNNFTLITIRDTYHKNYPHSNFF
jgi:hypothetical protein